MNLIKENKYVISFLIVVLASVGGSYVAGKQAGKEGALVAAKEQAYNVELEVWRQNMSNCIQFGRPNRTISSDNVIANERGWAYAQENRSNDARVTEGKEQEENLNAAKDYAEIVEDLKPLSNPTCLEQWGPRPVK